MRAVGELSGARIRQSPDSALTRRRHDQVRAEAGFGGDQRPLQARYGRKKAARRRLSNSEIALARSAIPELLRRGRSSGDGCGGSGHRAGGGRRSGIGHSRSGSSGGRRSVSNRRGSVSNRRSSRSSGVSSRSGGVSGLAASSQGSDGDQGGQQERLVHEFPRRKIGFEPLPVIRTPTLTAGIFAKDNRPSSSISCA
jgi:hypothetical protein